MKKLPIALFLLSLFLVSCKQKTTKGDATPKASKTEVKTEYPKVLEFPSLDSLTITAHLYQIDETSPFILLCHQARFNKFEYSGIAEKLNEMGFNCMAIDQRSGGPIGKTQNETYLRAVKKELAIDYLDAEPDIRAAIQYIAKNYSEKIILWGSSYSSTLALYLGVEMNEISAVISFSPGNYLADKKGSLIDKLEGFNKPMFLTSSKSEAKYVKALLEKHKMIKAQVHFIPEGSGHHGSRALWINQQGGEEYWTAIGKFLSSIKN
ncbi:MAG: lysophospholipase [Marinifilum sp.]|nr:lysophospholipase [Marinifilum sp.]